MSDRKTMIPELLPDPKANTAASQTSPRERVVKQMREMLKVGLLATSGALSSCGAFGVVDPMPRPARCEISNVDDGFAGTAHRTEEGIEVAINADVYSAGRYFSFANISDLQGGTLVREEPYDYYESSERFVIIAPDNGVSQVSFVLPFTCGYRTDGKLLDGTTALRVTVFLDDATDGGMPPDGGVEDAGPADAGVAQALRVTIEPVR